MDGISTSAPARAAGRAGRLLSYPLHPLVLGTPVALWVGIGQFGGLSAELAELIAWVAGLGLVFPMGLLYFLQRRGRISDFFITRHGDRRWVYPVGLADLGLIYALFYLYGAPPAVLATVAAALLAAAAMAVANEFIKVSLHCAGNAGIALALCWVEGWRWWPVWIVVGLTVWARLACREHTPSEAAAGLLLGALPTALAMAWRLGAPTW